MYFICLWKSFHSTLAVLKNTQLSVHVCHTLAAAAWPLSQPLMSSAALCCLYLRSTTLLTLCIYTGTQSIRSTEVPPCFLTPLTQGFLWINQLFPWSWKYNADDVDAGEMKHLWQTVFKVKCPSFILRSLIYLTKLDIFMNSKIQNCKTWKIMQVSASMWKEKMKRT